MYRQQISRQTSPVLTQTSDRGANHQRSPLVVQRAIATRNLAETDTVNKPLPIPEFKGISAQLLAETQPAPIQAKLTIGQPNDKYEQSADRVADRVVQQIYAPASIQTKQNIPAIQRSPIAQEFSPEAIAGGEASNNLSSAINSAKGGGQALDPKLQESMGEAMGADFSRVRVHTNSQSDRLNKSIQAKAFTTGRDVFFRQGTYQPGNRGGQKLIAHELTHVVQQKPNLGIYRSPEPNGVTQPREGSALSPSIVKRREKIRGKTPERVQRKWPWQWRFKCCSNPADINIGEPLRPPDPYNNPFQERHLLDRGLNFPTTENLENTNDLIYGVQHYRKVTGRRLAERNQGKRTIDEYNVAVGLVPWMTDENAAWEGIHNVRRALSNPTRWGDYLRGDNVDVINYPTQNEDANELSDIQKWMVLLVENADRGHKIGLYDLGNGDNDLGNRDNELAAILNRFEKNIFDGNQNIEGFNPEIVHRILNISPELDDEGYRIEVNNITNSNGNLLPLVGRWISNAFLRRTSKLGIDFATSEDGLNARVHFNLTTGITEAEAANNGDPPRWGHVFDGINEILNAIVERGEEQGYRKITLSEYRYAQRLINNNSALAAKIIFYNEY